MSRSQPEGASWRPNGEDGHGDGRHDAVDARVQDVGVGVENVRPVAQDQVLVDALAGHDRGADVGGEEVEAHAGLEYALERLGERLASQCGFEAVHERGEGAQVGR
jgi:hypothetical protein